MKRYFVFVVLILVFVAFGIAVGTRADATERLTNGDFESGGVGAEWKNCEGGWTYIATESTNVHAGSYAGKLNYYSVGCQRFGNPYSGQEIEAHITAYVKDFNGPATLKFLVGQNTSFPGNIPVAQQATVTTAQSGGNWYLLDATITIPDTESTGTLLAGFFVEGTAGTGWYIDDASLTIGPPATPTPTPTNTPDPTDTPTPTPTGTPVNSCALTWTFETGLAEWNTGLGNYYQGPGYVGYGLAFQNIGVGKTTFLQADEILSALSYSPTSFILSDGITIDLYSRQIGSSQSWIIFDYLSGTSETFTFGSPGVPFPSWQRSTISNATTGDTLNYISIVSRSDTAFYDNIVLDIPCENIVTYEGTPQPTNTPTNTPTPSPTTDPAATATNTPAATSTPPPPGSTNTPYPTATTGPTQTPPPWENPTATLPPPTQAPAPSPTPVGNPGGDPLPVPEAGIACYDLTPPVGYSIAYFGQWIIYLAALINNLFTCYLQNWLYNITNSMAGLITLFWNFSTWFWQSLANLNDLLVNMLSAWLQFAVQLFTEFGSWLIATFVEIATFWIGFFAQIFSNGLDWIQSAVEWIGNWLDSILDGMTPARFVYELMQSALAQAIQLSLAFAVAARDIFLTMAAAFIQLLSSMLNAVISFLEMLRDLFIAVRDAFSTAAYTIDIDGTGTIDDAQLDADGMNNSKVLWLLLLGATLIDNFVGTFQPYTGAVLSVIVGVLAIGVILWTMYTWRDVLPV